MGLIRSAVIVGIVVSLMPSDRAQQARIADQAASAVKWTVTFCDRNAATCTQASDVWGVFVKKAQFAGQLAFDLMQEQLNKGSAPSPAALDRSEAAPRYDRGTLSRQDAEPVWRGSRHGA